MSTLDTNSLWERTQRIRAARGELVGQTDGPAAENPDDPQAVEDGNLRDRTWAVQAKRRLDDPAESPYHKAMAANFLANRSLRQQRTIDALTPQPKPASQQAEEAFQAGMGYPASAIQSVKNKRRILDETGVDTRGMTNEGVYRLIKDEETNPAGVMHEAAPEPERPSQAVDFLQQAGPGGFRQGAAAIAQTAGGVADVLGFKETGTGLRDQAEITRSMTPPPQTVGGKVGAAIGSVAPAAIAIAAPEAAPALLGYYGVQGYGQADEAYRRWAAENGKEPDALTAAGAGLLGAAAEVLGEKMGLDVIGHIGMKRADSVIGLIKSGRKADALRVLAGAAESAGVNAGEEALTQVINNISAKELYNPEQNIGEGVVQSAIGGAIGGPVIGGAGVLGHHLRGRLNRGGSAQARANEAVGSLEAGQVGGTITPEDGVFPSANITPGEAQTQPQAQPGAIAEENAQPQNTQAKQDALAPGERPTATTNTEGRLIQPGAPVEGNSAIGRGVVQGESPETGNEGDGGAGTTGPAPVRDRTTTGGKAAALADAIRERLNDPNISEAERARLTPQWERASSLAERAGIPVGRHQAATSETELFRKPGEADAEAARRAQEAASIGVPRGTIEETPGFESPEQAVSRDRNQPVQAAIDKQAAHTQDNTQEDARTAKARERLAGMTPEQRAELRQKAQGRPDAAFIIPLIDSIDHPAKAGGGSDRIVPREEVIAQVRRDHPDSAPVVETMMSMERGRGFVLRDVPVGSFDIHMPTGTAAGEGINRANVKEYAGRSGETAPPIIAVRPGGSGDSLFVADGRHRLLAARLRKDSTVRAYVPAEWAARHPQPTQPKESSNAGQVSEAAAVHGDVQPQPREGQGQVPEQGGRPGVQPRAVQPSAGQEQGGRQERTQHEGVQRDAERVAEGRGREEKVAGASPERIPTSAREAMMSGDREALGLAALDGPERRGWEEALNRARDQGLSSPEQALRLAEIINADPQPISDIQSAALVHASVRLKNQHRALVKEIGTLTDPADIAFKSAEINRVRDEFDSLSRALKYSRTEIARALTSSKLTLDQDFDLLSVLNQAKAAKGAALSQKQEATFTKLTKAHEILTERVASLEKQLTEQVAVQAVKRHKATHRMTETERTAEFTSLLEKAKKLVKDGCH